MTGRGFRHTARWAGILMLASMAAVAALRPLLAPGDPFAMTGEALAPPSPQYPFGTDDLGRDVFTGVVHGAATSLGVGMVGALAAMVIGLLVGGVAGLRGGWVDHVLMRGTEFVQALPRFFMVLTVVSIFETSLALIVLVIGLTAWPGTARVFRSLVLATAERDFVLASRAAGGGDAGILLRHILPLTLPVAVAHASYQGGSAILAEAGLSFLGLGDPNVMSWGTQLGFAHHMVRDAWWMSVFPGLAVTLTVLGCNLVADSLSGRSAQA
ncbi:MAG: ABC transporter permease [Acidobacteriota bacterium]|nr:ABC transporter permease [Acidobacteriota bacterium]